MAQDLEIPYKSFVTSFVEAIVSVRGLAHFHLSGEVTIAGAQVEQHAQLPVATNRFDILEGLRIAVSMSGSTTPIILEGDPLPDDEPIGVNEPLSKDEIERRIELASTNILAEIELVSSVLTG